MQRTALLLAALAGVFALGAGTAGAAATPPTLKAPVNGLVAKGPSLTITYVLAETAAGLPMVTLTPASGTARTFPQANAAAGEHSLTLDLAAEAIADGTYGVKVGYEDPTDGVLESATATVVIDRSTPAPAPPPTAPPPAAPPVPAPTPAPAPDVAAPAITAARIVARSFSASRPSRARFRLSEAATVSFLLQRSRGRRWVRLSSSTKRAPAGDAFIRLPRGLKRGMHRLTIRATDAAGNASGPVRLSFRVR